jgi:hypothetical protein
MKCPSCVAENKEGATYCGNCGAALVVDDDATRIFIPGREPAIERPDLPPKATTPDQRASVTASSSSAARPASSEKSEIEFWRAIKESTDAEDYGLYLDRFPRGTYADLARRRMTKLRPGSESAVAPLPASSAADDATVLIRRESGSPQPPERLATQAVSADSLAELPPVAAAPLVPAKEAAVAEAVPDAVRLDEGVGVKPAISATAKVAPNADDLTVMLPSRSGATVPFPEPRPPRSDNAPGAAGQSLSASAAASAAPRSHPSKAIFAGAAVAGLLMLGIVAYLLTGKDPGPATTAVVAPEGPVAAAAPVTTTAAVAPPAPAPEPLSVGAPTTSQTAPQAAPLEHANADGSGSPPVAVPASAQTGRTDPGRKVELERKRAEAKRVEEAQRLEAAHRAEEARRPRQTAADAPAPGNATPQAVAESAVHKPSSPDALCADAGNIFSRGFCESRACKQSEWKDHPFCVKKREQEARSTPMLGGSN